jgi:hypothetical protein
MKQEAYERYIVDSSGSGASIHTVGSNTLINAKNVRVAEHLANLYAYLLENHCIDCLVGFDSNILTIFSRDVLKKIWKNDAVWETMVPLQVARAIRERGLFGYADQPAATTGHIDTLA